MNPNIPRPRADRRLGLRKLAMYIETGELWTMVMFCLRFYGMILKIVKMNLKTVKLEKSLEGS